MAFLFIDERKLMIEYVIRDYRSADNQGLADMWNQSQSAWPTGFGGNVDFTAQRVAEDMKKQQALFYLVAEQTGKIIGYCWVSSYPKEPDACYVALLNAHPDYHGQGVGKGLLLESIRRAVKLGYYRVDLHTWPSNAKAVPLYKKTGFFWLPETQVHMQNYIPAVLAHPLCRDFFARHDWYRTFVRKLDQEPDEVKIGERRVFPYRFQAGNEYVEVTFDMESRRAYAVETDKVKVRIVLDDPEVMVGMKQRVEIKCSSPENDKVKVAWLRTKNRKISLKPAGKSAELTVDPEVETPEEQMPALSVGARVALGSLCFKLEAGIRPKQPVELGWEPKYPDFSIKERARLWLTMLNNTGRRARVSLNLKHRNSVQARLANIAGIAEKEGKTGCLLEVAKWGKGVDEMLVKLNARFGRRMLSSKSYRVPLFNIGHGQRPALWQDERKAIWETPCFRAEVIRRGGEIDLTEKHTGLYIASVNSSLGPPFWPNEFDNIKFKARKNGESLVVWAESQQVPGLRFEKIMSITQEHSLELRHRVFNGSKGKGNYRVSLSVWDGAKTPRARKVIPLVQGFVGISGPNPFGGLSHELPHKPEDYKESWWANEDGGAVTGVAWQKAAKIDYPSLELDLGRIKPGASAETPPVYFLFGPGDHVLVRRWYLQYIKGQSPEDYRKCHVIPRISADFEPPVLFLTSGERQRTIFAARNLSNQDMPADLSVRLPDGQEHRASCPSVKLGHDCRKDIELEWTKTEPATGTITGIIGLQPIEKKFGIISVGNRAEPVKVEKTEEQGLEVWIMDNGLCRFKASPHFLGSLFSWTFGGREQLLSSFPKPGNFSWERPWYGGIAPVLHPANSWGRNLLVKERFSAGQAQVKGKTGFVWRGVKMSCRPADRKAKGLLIGISYLTLPRCPVAAIVTTCRNTTAGCMHFGYEAVGFVSPGGEYRGTRLGWYQCGQERRYLRGDKGAWAESERWGAAENPATGETIVMAIPQDQSAQAVLLMDYGHDGGHLGQAMDIKLRPGEVKSFFAFWGVAGSNDKSTAFCHLAELKELP